MFVGGSLAAAAGLWTLAAGTRSAPLRWFAWTATAAVGATAWFFRNPRRVPPRVDGPAILAPADGRIVAIGNVEEPEYLRQPALRISTFLSLFDVHVNRAPVSGTVEYRHHRPGRFRGAFRPEASAENERLLLGVRCDDGGRIAVAQIAGFVARRIVCRVDSGVRLERGEEYGMIRFGSRTDLFVPPGTQLNVGIGERVRAGVTVIGERRG
jgi:phosphatidylserine decarboxylase